MPSLMALSKHAALCKSRCCWLYCAAQLALSALAQPCGKVGVAGVHVLLSSHPWQAHSPAQMQEGCSKHRRRNWCIRRWAATGASAGTNA
eukprot:1156017-Pelagomonas_calceolata.AAC.4